MGVIRVGDCAVCHRSCSFLQPIETGELRCPQCRQKAVAPLVPVLVRAMTMEEKISFTCGWCGLGVFFGCLAGMLLDGVFPGPAFFVGAFLGGSLGCAIARAILQRSP